MSDMLVKLYCLEQRDYEGKLADEGISIKRALIPDKNRILDFVRKNFEEAWVNECEYALFNSPITCYIAVKNKNIIGFACYDATAKDFFGPIGVMENEQGTGVGKALLHRTLNSMKESGYAYAIIGWVGDAINFYKKEVHAIEIIDSEPNRSVYKNLISME